MLLNSIRGFFMALADSIPGISGGTIAYLLGFYDLFIDSLNNIISNNKEKRKNSLTFIIQLGCGWIVGLIICVSILSTLFTNHIYIMSSFLIGLTIFSIPEILKEEKSSFDFSPKGMLFNIFFFLFGLILVILITTYSSRGSASGSAQLISLDAGKALFLFIAGDIAISTMVLPGISGSSLLMILGLYLPIINALKVFFGFDFSVVPSLFCFGFGILFGIFTTVRLVKKALEFHRSSTLSLILGLVVAATYAIAQGPTSLEIPKAPLSFETFSFISFIIGWIPILLITYLKKRKIGVHS
ncbi:MAG: DUF368 domain-containing protein [Spirochaetaceae bacterium]|nr:DUF368 domain-containing protein [Spirochaetaceae bacterium]